MKNFIVLDANRKNLLQLIFLRLFAIFGQILTIVLSGKFLLLQLPTTQMFIVVGLLTLVNISSFLRYRRQKNISDKSLFFELIFDVIVLTTQLYFSGGISNPFISLFLLQVIIGAILLRAVFAWFIALITIGCYVWLNFNFVELSFPEDNFFDIHLHGMLISYVIAAALLLIFITKMAKNLREQQEFMRSAMLATAAAHDLGTPLNTISVILEDWQKFEAAKFSSEMKKDLNLVESQVKRCKEAVSKILSASKTTRLEQVKNSDFQ